MFESLQNLLDDLKVIDQSKIEGGNYAKIKDARYLLMELRDEAQSQRLKLMDFYYAKHPKKETVKKETTKKNQ